MAHGTPLSLTTGQTLPRTGFCTFQLQWHVTFPLKSLNLFALWNRLQLLIEILPSSVWFKVFWRFDAPSPPRRDFFSATSWPKEREERSCKHKLSSEAIQEETCTCKQTIRTTQEKICRHEPSTEKREDKVCSPGPTNGRREREIWSHRPANGRREDGICSLKPTNRRRKIEIEVLMVWNSRPYVCLLYSSNY